MKKQISIVLSIVLTIALLASSFVMLGVSAEDPATEKLTIGTNEYEIYTDKKFSAYDSMAAAVNGLTPDSTPEGTNNAYNQAPEVSFSNTDWSVNGKQLWGGGIAQTPIYIKTDDAYTQIAFYNQSVAFGCYSVSLYNDGLHVNPSHGWLGSNEIYALNLNYTAKEEGNVVIYDNVGTVSSSSGSNAYPFWDWLTENVGKDWVTFSIYKNNTLLWPKNGEDNKFEAGGEQIAFPDLGAIAVAVGDVITVKVEGFSSRAGIDINPVIAYTTAQANEDDTDNTVTGGEEITIGDNKYLIDPNGKSNARDVIANALTNTAFDADTNVTLSGVAWNVQAKYADWAIDNNFAYFQKEGLSKLAFENWIADNWSHEIVIQENGLVINPGDNSNSGNISLIYKAPKNGEVVIYDIAGELKALKDSAPYWAWWDGCDREMTVTVYKNDTAIWPTSNENNKLKVDSITLAFPDLGKIEVLTGDTITIEFAATKGFTHTLTDLEIAYIYEEPVKENQVVIGDNTYTILPEHKYSAYEDLSKLAANYKPENKSDVKFTGKWSIDAKYTKTSEYGKDPWGTEFGFKYQAVNTSGEYVGFQSSHYMTGNAYTPASVILNDSTKKLMVSPYILWSESVCDVASQRLVFTADRPGSVILYDEFGIFDGNGFATDPYWANEAAYPNKKTYVEIHKNGKKIWPVDNETPYINGENLAIEFPDLGEIKVKAGDQIAIVYNASNVTDRCGVANAPVVAYTKVTGAPQTDADFGTEVMILVSVITVLGAVVVAMGVASKKRGFIN